MVTEKDLKQLYPFDDRYYVVQISGKELKECFDYLFSLKPDGSVMNGTFQYSRGFHLEVDAEDCWVKGAVVKTISLHGEKLDDDRFYAVGMTGNCIENCYTYFGKVFNAERCKMVSLSTYNDLARWFLSQTDEIVAPEKNRFVIENLDFATAKK